MVCAAPARSERASGVEVEPGARRKRRREKLRAEIFRVAMGLFSKRGYERVTVDEIAAATDIAKGTFFNYYPTKEHLLLEYRHSLLDDLHRYGASLEGTSARALVCDYFGTLARRVTAEGERYEMLFKEVVARPHLIALDREHSGRYRPYFERFVEIGKRAGEIPAHADTTLFIETLRDIWTGTSVAWMLEHSHASLDVLVLEKINHLFDLAGRPEPRS